MKTLSIKRTFKEEREKTVLIGLIELYIKDGKPVGSSTLQANGFKNISSSTIRNYFSKLEEGGYLIQQHSSGGRIPTKKGYEFYVNHCLLQGYIDKTDEKLLKEALPQDGSELLTYLYATAEALSDLTKCPIFMLPPKLEIDFIQKIRLFPIDEKRLLCLLLSDFGYIRYETLYIPHFFSLEETQSIEEYFYWRLSKREKKPLFQNEVIAKWAQRIYNEIMVRHVVGYSTDVELYKTGLSKLLCYPEFTSATALASSLSLFENEEKMRSILLQSMQQNGLTCKIGEESIIALPYKACGITIGAIAILGPNRLPYKKLFSLLMTCSNHIQKVLGNSLSKFKIPFMGKPSKMKFLLEHKRIKARKQ